MATQKPGEWASCILSRFEEQVNSFAHIFIASFISFVIIIIISIGRLYLIRVYDIWFVFREFDGRSHQSKMNNEIKKKIFLGERRKKKGWKNRG